MLDFGIIEAFKVFHPSFVTSASTKLFYDQFKNPSSYDYLYVSENMRNNMAKCDLIKDEFIDVYSDHYPVVLIYRK